MYEHGGDIYSHLNCMDFSTNISFPGIPRQVKEALHQGIEECEHYPDVRMQALRESIAGFEGVTPEQVICGNGAAELIFQLAAAVRPQKALLLAPGFQEYEQALSFFGCQICFYDLKEENGFLPGEDLIGQIDTSVEMLFLCNPNNPTGLLFDAGWMGRVIKRCGDTGTILVADECFQDFVEDRDRMSMKKYMPDYSNLFILKAFTKIFAMPGLRLGYGICGDRKLLEQMRAGSQPWNVSVLAQKAGCAAAGLQDYIEEMKKCLRQEKSYLMSELQNLNFKTYGSAANFIFFRGPENLGNELLGRGFLIRDCSNYRGLEKGYYRIVVRSRSDNEALIHAMRECTEVR